jgi:hypothetical protein
MTLVPNQLQCPPAASAYERAATAWAFSASACQELGISRGTTPFT